MAEWIKKQDPRICFLQKTHFTPKDTDRPTVMGMKKTFLGNGKQTNNKTRGKVDFN